MALVEEPTISTRSGELAWLVDCLAPIFDGLRQPVTVVDPSGRFVYYNRASGLLDGLDPQRALGMHLLQSAPWLAAEQSTLLRCLAEGRPSIDTLQAYVGPAASCCSIATGDRCAGATVACSARWSSAKSSPRPKRPQAWRIARTS